MSLEERRTHLLLVYENRPLYGWFKKGYAVE